jgi:hypothetical protein
VITHTPVNMSHEQQYYDLPIAQHNNILNQIKMNHVDIENAIRKYDLVFSAIKNEKAEWKTELPPFVYCFYKYLMESQQIFTQSEFWHKYQYMYDDFFANTNHIETEAIKARIYRAYPSLIRDLHFAKYLCRAAKNKSIVYYNPRIDVEYGIDLLLIKGNDNYGINLYTQTNRSLQGRRKKSNRHPVYNNVINIELPVRLGGADKCGKFFIYGKKELEDLKKHIVTAMERRCIMKEIKYINGDATNPIGDGRKLIPYR